MPQLRSWMAEDFKRLVEYALRQYGMVPGRVQYLMADFLQSKISLADILDVSGYGNIELSPGDDASVKFLIAMRGITKTTLVHYYTAWRYLRVPHTRVMIFSGNERWAAQMASAIKVVMCDLPFMAHIAPSPSVSTMQFDLRNVWKEQTKSVTSVSILSNLVSTRTDLAIFDDIETPDNTDDPDKRDFILKKAEQIWSILHPVGRILSRLWSIPIADIEAPLPEQTQVIGLGTYQHRQSIYLETTQISEGVQKDTDPFRGRELLRIPALDENGNSVFEERMPTKVLMGRRGKMSPLTWELQFMVNPQPDVGEGTIVNMKAIEQVECPELQMVTACIDPAEGGDDEWGIVIGGRTLSQRLHLDVMTGLQGAIGGPDGYLFDGEEPNPGTVARLDGTGAVLLNDRNLRGTDEGDPVHIQSGVLDAVIEMLQLKQVRKVYIEKNRKVICRLLVRTIRNRGLDIAIETFSVSMRKDFRVVEAIVPAVNSGMISMSPSVLAPHSPDGMRNRYQLENIRYGKLPEPNDRIDAMSTMILELLPEMRKANPTFQTRKPVTSLKSLKAGNI